jgi:hypothetical protein
VRLEPLTSNFHNSKGRYRYKDNLCAITRRDGFKSGFDRLASIICVHINQIKHDETTDVA